MICRRCGFVDQEEQISRRVERGGEQLCGDCVARPSKKIRTKFGVCKPHRGKFDEFDNPLDDQGNLIRPGYRRCGNMDCIAVEHCIDPLEMERISISYRTGETLTVAELFERLMKEHYGE